MGDPVRRLVIAADGSLSIRQVGPDNIGVYTCTVTFGDQRQSISAMLKIIGNVVRLETNIELIKCQNFLNDNCKPN